MPCAIAHNCNMETNVARFNGKGKSCGRKISVRVTVGWIPRQGGPDVQLTAEGHELRPAILNNDAAAWLKCECGKWHFIRRVVGKFVAEKGCDGRCMSATGHNCECSCGGKNHGAGWVPKMGAPLKSILRSA